MSWGNAIFCYDANGNMTQKIDGSTTSYTYDAENRMSAVSGAATATFVYDGDGNRVKGVVGGVTTTYIGNHFEWTGSTSTMKKYYYAGGTRVAERKGTTLYWLLSDHLGSTSITATSSGSKTAELRYKPWGETRYTYGTTQTTIRYTGQREESSLGLYWYNSRWYSPGLSRFLSADTIIPQPGSPLAWDRYAYVNSNPVRNVDPTGHFTDEAIQNYLKSNYGDGWEDIWNGWLKDKAWMDTLHGAQAGDTLSRVWFDSDGNAQISNYIIDGVSDRELHGLSGTGSPDLNSVYKTSSGIGVVRSDSELGFKEVGHVGQISYDIHQVSHFEGAVNYWVYFGGCTLLTFVNIPFEIIFGSLGLALGAEQYFNPTTATMGFYEGDIYLRIKTFYATGVDGPIMEGIRTQWTYIFRGDYQEVYKTNTPIYNPHRPY